MIESGTESHGMMRTKNRTSVTVPMAVPWWTVNQARHNEKENWESNKQTNSRHRELNKAKTLTLWFLDNKLSSIIFKKHFYDDILVCFRLTCSSYLHHCTRQSKIAAIDNLGARALWDNLECFIYFKVTSN